MKSSELQQILTEKFESLAQRLENLAAGELSSPLAPEKWSKGQIARHLILSTRAVTKGLELPKEALAERFGLRAETVLERDYDTLIALYRQVLSGGLVAPARLAPEPVSEEEKGEITAQVRQELADMKAALSNWNETELSDYLMPHPAFGLLTIREMLVFTIFHTDHHMGQMG